MMGKVLVRKAANPDATNLVSSFLGEGPKTKWGAGLGGLLGAITGLSRLATAGEQQQDAISGLGSAGLAAYGGYKGGASLGDMAANTGGQVTDKLREKGVLKPKQGTLPPPNPMNLVPEGGGRKGSQGEWSNWAKEGFDIPNQLGVIGNPNEGGTQSVSGFQGFQPNLFDATETDFRLTTDKIDPVTGEKMPTALGRRIKESAPKAPSSTPMHSIQAGNAAAVLHPWEHSPKAGVAITPPASPDPFKPVQGTTQMDSDMPSSIDQSMGGNEDGEHITPESAVTDLNPAGVASFAGKPEHEKMIEDFHDYFGKGEPMDIAFLILKAVMK